MNSTKINHASRRNPQQSINRKRSTYTYRKYADLLF